jgi:hypothetical protein
MRALPYIAAALVGCATVPAGPPAPPPEEAFRGVKGVALVHRVPWSGVASPGPGEGRTRDPLDALQVALEQRGVATVTVELPDHPAADLAAVDALARRAEELALGASPGVGADATVGNLAAPVLARLGVDALAVYVRGGPWGAPPPSPFWERSLLVPPLPPASAIALVARDGTVLAFAWGGGSDPYGEAGPVNAAEAVDAVLALLAPRVAE